jgi:shikimate kinase
MIGENQSGELSIVAAAFVTSQKILIVGFMGTGKSTVARALARKLNCAAVDLDEWITRDENRSPRQIIESDGETAFRILETRALRRVFEEPTLRIIAAGGGAWTMAENRRLVQEQGAFSVWLDAPFAQCWERIRADETRPLARTREAAERLYAERRPIYELADARIVVSPNESAEDVASAIVYRISQRMTKTADDK